MNNSVKQISASDIIFSSKSSATSEEYSPENQFLIMDKYVSYGTSTSISKPDDIYSEETFFEINKLQSFLQLPANWDSYGAAKPAKIAVENAIHFIIRLANRQQEPFFIAPSPNGDILVELKDNSVSLEFVFGESGTNYITGLVNNEEIFQKDLNETNESCSLKWLYCPDGDCSNWE
jgi:hypothetical protein